MINKSLPFPFSQIINLMWLLGSLAYVLAVHSKETLSITATSRLWVIGGVSYFLGGLLAVSAPLAFILTSWPSFNHHSQF
jgi:hypothetical protein